MLMQLGSPTFSHHFALVSSPALSESRAFRANQANSRTTLAATQRAMPISTSRPTIGLEAGLQQSHSERR